MEAGTSENEEKDLLLAEQEQDLAPEIKEKMSKGKLRTGYTTGTSASAASKAALIAILENKQVKSVTVSLPKNKLASIQIAWTRVDSQGQEATSAVIKDGGDDPDITHGAEICATITLNGKTGSITIEGGSGVGRVTKPGLGLEIGKAAINPVPMKMIYNAISEVGSEILKKKGIQVTISVPKGEEIAKKTDNPRLGILGGISILGTTGIVLPYSTASFAASIRQSIDVSLAQGWDWLILTTGGRSEDFAKKLFGTELPDHAFVQMGDFAGYTVKQCSNKRVRKIVIAGFIGKLTKMAMGIKQTHVRGSHVNMEFMAQVARECGASEQTIQEIRAANTARHVSEIINKSNISGFFDAICHRVFNQMHKHSQGNLELQVIMFEFDGTICGSYPTFGINP